MNPEETKVRMDILFGRVEMHNMPPRIDGKRLYFRGRTIWRDRDGIVKKDEVYETGMYVENWESSAHLFGIEAPARSWLQRFWDWFA